MYKDHIFLEVFCHTTLTVKYVEKFNAEKKYVKQEGIPVGCVPFAWADRIPDVTPGVSSNEQVWTDLQ